MDDMRFYVHLNTILAISGRWVSDDEKQCAMEPNLKDPHLKRGSNPGQLDQQPSA